MELTYDRARHDFDFGKPAKHCRVFRVPEQAAKLVWRDQSPTLWAEGSAWHTRTSAAEVKGRAHGKLVRRPNDAALAAGWPTS